MDHPHLKRIRVVKYDCKEFANRLWNDMAIYATGLELGVQVTGPSPLQSMPGVRWIYEVWAQFVGRVLHDKESLFAWGGTVRYLPPTTPLPGKYEDASSLYLLGQLFRNPAGFVTYGKELKERFGASPSCKKRIERTLAPYAGRLRIGVEVRQHPFTYFPDGEFLVPLERTRQVVDEYLQENGLASGDVVLIVMTDRPVPPGLFTGFCAVYANGSRKYNFELLSSTNVVIGTNSSLANLAAWFGNVPHIVTSVEPIDWEYYRGKNLFFENKYATFTQKISLKT